MEFKDLQIKYQLIKENHEKMKKQLEDMMVLKSLNLHLEKRIRDLIWSENKPNQQSSSHHVFLTKPKHHQPQYIYLFLASTYLNDRVGANIASGRGAKNETVALDMKIRESIRH